METVGRIAFIEWQKRALAQQARELNRALALGKNGVARSVSLGTLLKEARRRHPELAR